MRRSLSHEQSFFGEPSSAAEIWLERLYEQACHGVLHLSSCEQNTRAARFILCSRPFSSDRLEDCIRAGETIAGALRRKGLDPDRIAARVLIDDRLIPSAEWEYASPAAGELVTARVIPTDGGGGKDILRIVAMIGVVILSIAAPYLLPGLGPALGGFLGVSGQIGSALATAGIGIIGSLAINALIPPPKPKLADLGGLGNTSPTLSLTGSKNQLAPYAPVPRVYGTHRMFPPLAATPYTEIVGSDQYLRLLFCLGYGPLALADFKIGPTPLDQFAGVQMEVRYGYPNDAPLTLIPRDVFEDALSIKLTNAAGFQQRTGQANTHELSVDVVFPNGLIAFDTNNQNAPIAATVEVQVEYRKQGDVSWTAVQNTLALQASATTAFTGANNDLTVTVRVAGSPGNRYALLFAVGTLLVVGRMQLPNRAGGFITTDTFSISVPLGTTGTQLKTALEAHAEFNSLFTVAHAPGNSGAGAITLPTAASAWLTTPTVNYQFKGGRDFRPSMVFTAKSFTLLRRSLRWEVDTPGAQYEVRVKRFTADRNQQAFRDEVYWTMLRTIQSSRPVTQAGLCLVALRIKATDQLNGTVDTFNCLASSILLEWDGTAWLPSVTSNPASIYRDVFQGAANAKAVADSRIDLTTLQTWHSECAAADREFNAVIDFRTSVFELARDVAAVGRASFSLRDGLYSVVRDVLQVTPVQVFTPRNSSGFRGTKAFVDLPHALKVRFVNPVKDWQQDERIVYADGYTVNNASVFETLDLFGVTDADQAWKAGRYHLAVAALRPETYEITVDPEHLVCTRGDLVRVVHDVPLFGAGFARVKSVTTDGGGNATAVTLDDVMTMDATKSYAARFRKADGTTVVQQVVTVAGDSSSLTFTVAIPTATKPAVGNLMAFGELGRESVELLIKDIRQGSDLTATLMLVDAAPAVHQAETGTIPPFDSQITIPASVQTPAKPIIVQVQSDETVLLRDVDGSYQSRIVVTLHFLSGVQSVATHVEAQYQVTGSEAAWSQIFAPVSGTAVDVSIAPVQDGEMYDLRLRSVNQETGVTSEWATIGAHTVIGKTTRPPDVTGLTFDSAGIRWAYPDPPIDFDGFLVRIRPGTDVVWDDAFQLNDVPITGTTYPIIPDGSTRVIMVKAIDVAGLESATPAWILQDASALVLRNLAETIDYKALGFPGIKTNCTVVGGNLTADSQTLFWSNDTALFWSSNSTLFWQGSYKDMTYVATVTPPANWLTGIMRLQVGISAQGWTVEYRPGSTSLFWSSDSAAFWSSDGAAFWQGTAPDFTTWPGALEFPKRQDYEFRISAVGGQVQGVLSALNVLFDMPDLREVIDALLIPVGGRRLPLTKSFHAIKAVTPSLIGTTYPATKVKVLDNQLLPGPLVDTYDDANAEVAGQIYAVVDGY